MLGNADNFNFIKGRNSFQKNWLIETAKKRNLNLNDPNTFSKLATEFAKTYPNDQGMFGLSKGFIPNFASMISSSIKGKGNISAIKTGKNNYEALKSKTCKCCVSAHNSYRNFILLILQLVVQRDTKIESLAR